MTICLPYIIPLIGSMIKCGKLFSRNNENKRKVEVFQSNFHSFYFYLLFCFAVAALLCGVRYVCICSFAELYFTVNDIDLLECLLFNILKFLEFVSRHSYHIFGVCEAIFTDVRNSISTKWNVHFFSKSGVYILFNISGMKKDVFIL